MKQTNLSRALRVPVWPHYRGPEPVRLSYKRPLWYNNPLSVQSYTIMAVARIPIDVLDTDAVRKRAAQRFAACESIKPLLERRIGEPAIITRELPASVIVK